jgi:hypothetical protein
MGRLRFRPQGADIQEKGLWRRFAVDRGYLKAYVGSGNQALLRHIPLALVMVYSPGCPSSFPETSFSHDIHLLCLLFYLLFVVVRYRFSLSPFSFDQAVSDAALLSRIAEAGGASGNEVTPIFLDSGMGY